MTADDTNCDSAGGHRPPLQFFVRSGRDVLLLEEGNTLPYFLQSYFASGLGRTWSLITLLVFPLPPSTWNGARVAYVVQMPFPFQPAPGLSMRPSIPFA